MLPWSRNHDRKEVHACSDPSTLSRSPLPQPQWRSAVPESRSPPAAAPTRSRRARARQPRPRHSRTRRTAITTIQTRPTPRGITTAGAPSAGGRQLLLGQGLDRHLVELDGRTGAGTIGRHLVESFVAPLECVLAVEE